MAKLLNGNFKAFDMGYPLVKIEDDSFTYIDDRLDETRKFQIEYGEVNTKKDFTKELKILFDLADNQLI